jgi:dephospho-CoA kinase
MNDAEKLKYADYIIENNSSLKQLKKKVLRVIRQIQETSKE